MTDYTDLKRYEPDNPLDNAPSMREVADGDWVRYSDAADAIAALQEEVARLVQQTKGDAAQGVTLVLAPR